jgi:hypothetical protein
MFQSAYFANSVMLQSPHPPATDCPGSTGADVEAEMG